ncbi:MAG: type II secretion system inner membrane protein GspF [Deltaproteobacteria bacterium]|nr:type II secretion system inner membrane protein GspF [Deltaproteobacteria bacterium]
MALYAYKGFDARGKNVSGLKDAESPKSLRAVLRKDGIMVATIEESLGDKKAQAVEKAGAFSLKASMERVSAQELAVSTRQLATLIGAAIPLVDALTALVDQIEHPRLRSVYGQIKQRVNEGASLADAMADHPKVFSGLFVNMIRAGESSGALDVVLIRLADFTENQAKLTQKIVGAMFYPAIMVMMAVVVVGIMMTFVVPKIVKIFENQKAALPLPTEILILASDGFRNFWWVVVLLMIGAAFWFTRFRKTVDGRKKIDQFKLKMPFFGEVMRMLAVARFTRTLSTLLGSGVPLLVAFEIVKNIVNNVILTEAIEQARGSIQEGESIAAPLKRSGQFPPIVTHMIAVGEKSGQLEEMLGKIADAYDSQVESRVMMVTSLLEPILIIAMGAAVAFIVFAILLPMLQMGSFAK